MSRDISFFCRFNETDTNNASGDVAVLVCTAHGNTGTKTGLYLVMTFLSTDRCKNIWALAQELLCENN